MNVSIKVIPHNKHRPEAGNTVGDWWFVNESELNIRVSRLMDEEGNEDPYFELLVAHH